MNLSAEQKQTLREGFARGVARSAALKHELAPLLRRLDVQMLCNHVGAMERINQVGNVQELFCATLLGPLTMMMLDRLCIWWNVVTLAPASF